MGRVQREGNRNVYNLKVTFLKISCLPVCKQSEDIMKEKIPVSRCNKSR